MTLKNNEYVCHFCEEVVTLEHAKQAVDGRVTCDECIEYKSYALALARVALYHMEKLVNHALSLQRHENEEEKEE